MLVLLLMVFVLVVRLTPKHRREGSVCSLGVFGGARYPTVRLRPVTGHQIQRLGMLEVCRAGWVWEFGASGRIRTSEVLSIASRRR